MSKAKTTKRRLPEALCGWNRPDNWGFFAGIAYTYKKRDFPSEFPAALVPLPRPLRRGETVAVRIVKKKGAGKGGRKT